MQTNLVENEDIQALVKEPTQLALKMYCVNSSKPWFKPMVATVAAFLKQPKTIWEVPRASSHLTIKYLEYLAINLKTKEMLLTRAS